MSKKKLLFTGPVLTASGYGVHARQLLSALHESGEFDLYVESIRWGETPFLTDPGLEWIRKLAARNAPAQPDVHVHVSIPNEFKRRAPLEIGVVMRTGRDGKSCAGARAATTQAKPSRSQRFKRP